MPDMPVVPCSSIDAVHGAIAHEAFAFVRGGAMRDILAPFGSLADWHAFADSWNALELDTYMADGGRYRRRRHAVFAAISGAGAITRQPHQPHYQSVDYNPLHGGVERWFAPVLDDIVGSDTLTTILTACRSLFGSLAPGAKQWHIEIHQFRIEANATQVGRPTPEGLHRDGVDYVLVLLVNRRNIASGVTGIHNLDGRPLGSFTLTDPLDAAFVDDQRVAHGVTPVEPIDRDQPAYRDVLVVTFRGKKNE
jgi:hypothetical protein